MGRPYRDEMDAMCGTYEWALSSDVGSLSDFATVAEGSPLYAVGTGGSLTAATLAAALHHDTGSAAEALTPLAFLERERIDCSAASVLIFTAGGSNADIIAAMSRAVALCPRALAVVCLSPRSKVARIAARTRGIHLQAARVPAGRDGFLATNSLLTMSVWACKAYGEAGLACYGGFPRFSTLMGDATKSASTGASVLRGCSTLTVLHDVWGKIAAVDLESKMVEGGLAGVHVADYRHFGHGRHNWLDKRSDSGVVALVSPGCERLASATLRHVPDGVPVMSLETPLDGPVGSLALLTKAMRLVGTFGETLGVDPGRPRVAAFGRRLYSLRYHPPLLGRATAVERAALCRKFGTHREAGPGARRLGDLRRFMDEMMRQKFGGIVLDYDGTLVDTQDRQKPPKTVVKKILASMLSCGIVVCVATGRGKSAGKALRNVIPIKYWPCLLVGYYNGADVRPLDDVDAPNTSDPIDPVLDEFMSVRGLGEALDGAKRDIRPRQITYEGHGLSADDIMGRLAEIAPSIGRKVKVVESAHSIDVIAATTTKKALTKQAKASIRTGLSVLCMGDMGKRPGNDYELLSNPYSLSVGEVSGDSRTCWNLLPTNIQGTAGTVHYMQKFKAHNGHFRVGELR